MDTFFTWAAVIAPVAVPFFGWMIAVERRLGALARVEQQVDRLVEHLIQD